MPILVSLLTIFLGHRHHFSQNSLHELGFYNYMTNWINWSGSSIWGYLIYAIWTAVKKSSYRSRNFIYSNRNILFNLFLKQKKALERIDFDCSLDNGHACCNFVNHVVSCLLQTAVFFGLWYIFHLQLHFRILINDQIL